MIRLAILISGSGTTASAVLKACREGKLKGMETAIVISSRSDALGLAKAKSYNVPTIVINPKELLPILRTHRIDVISQNGWLPLTPPEVIDTYEGKIINQHPGPLDPGYLDFGGKGMFGKRVIAARMAYAWMIGRDYWTEATTHHVTAEYDKGQLVRTEKLSIPTVARLLTLPQLRDSSQKLIDATNRVAAALLPLEHTNVIASLQTFAQNRSFSTFRRTERLVSPENSDVVTIAKKLAAELFPKG
jgi:phosphoribosylglycinamide formyltransferase 1